MVLDMLKSNLHDYLYARESRKRNISLYFLNYLSAWLFFSCTQLCLMLGAVLINPALTKLSCYPSCTSKRRKFKHFVGKTFIVKFYQRKKNLFLCSSQIEKNSIRLPKNKAFNYWKLHKDAIPTLFSHQTEKNIGKSTNRENRLRLILKFF